MELSGLSFPTASKVIETLVELGIAREITGGRRNLLFGYYVYLKTPARAPSRSQNLIPVTALSLAGSIG
jgi:hypothetical protein